MSLLANTHVLRPSKNMKQNSKKTARQGSPTRDAGKSKRTWMSGKKRMKKLYESSGSWSLTNCKARSTMAKRRKAPEISDVHRSSQISVQGCIRFDRQILPAHCNLTGFKSIGLQRQPDLTGSGSGLNIVKRDSTGFKYYPVRLDRLSAFVTYKRYKSRLKLRFVRYDVTGMLIMTGFMINCPLYMINCPLHNFGSPRSLN